MPIFISHSQKDIELVNRVKKALDVLGTSFNPIVYEDFPPAKRSGPDWDNIGRLIRESDIVLLFHTPNVDASKHTQSWVGHEVAVAANKRKPLVVFQILNKPPAFPLTYWTDLVLIDPERPESILQIQEIVKRHFANTRWRHSKLARFVAGGAAGSPLGPIGAGLGALMGAQ